MIQIHSQSHITLYFFTDLGVEVLILNSIALKHKSTASMHYVIISPVISSSELNIKAISIDEESNTHKIYLYDHH